MERTAYEILGVSPTATDEEIKKQYHTLMRNLHPDATIKENLSPEQKEENLKRVKEYNEAFDSLSRGRRADYDKKLAQERGSKIETSDVVRSASSYENTQYTSSEHQTYYQPQEEVKSDARTNIEKIVLDQFDELFQNILNKGFTFSGSITNNSNQKLKQEYWKLKQEKENLEKQLKEAEQEAKIEFMKKSSTNDIQLNIEFGNLSSRIASFECDRNGELSGAQQNYFFRASRRFVTQKKCERLRQQLVEEENQINTKYNAIIEVYRRKQDENRKAVAKYQKELKQAIESDSKVLSVKRRLSQLQSRIDLLEEKLGYKTQSSGYASEYGEKSRVSV
ncbi:MAG: DnaJ domain-containing protein [Bacilli bacterium]|nr:DnaJ domain-containing protein [Bacilli bacterium]